jgi:hypothetical protein
MKPFVLSLAIVALSALGQARASCALSAVDVRAWDSPDTSTYEEMALAKRHILRFIACRSRPDAASRAVLFHVIEKEFTFPYTEVRRRWMKARGSRGGGKSTRAESESQVHFEEGLSRYLDRTVGRDDLPFKRIILELGSGRAIAALGREIRHEVVRQAGTPTGPKGLTRHYPQAEAFKALGYWLDQDDETLTREEKLTVQTLLLESLPKKAFLSGRRIQTPVTDAVLTALGHASDPHVADAVMQWSNGLPANWALRMEAQECATSVRQKVRE